MREPFPFDVFLSHHAQDKPCVPRLTERLKAEMPIHPSPFILHPSHTGLRFIPLLLGDCALPDTLRRYKYVDFREESEEASVMVGQT